MGSLLSIAGKKRCGAFPRCFIFGGDRVIFHRAHALFPVPRLCAYVTARVGGMVSPKAAPEAAPEAEPNRSEPHPGGTVTPVSNRFAPPFRPPSARAILPAWRMPMLMGGAGAVFWMWVAAFIGMILKYAECVLAVQFRTVTPDGVRGGAMVYLEKGVPPAFRKLAYGGDRVQRFGTGASFGRET